jgi:hypothetical protein
VPWPADASGADRRELAGVTANLVSLAALKRGKAAPRDDAADAAKNQADAATLALLDET